MTLDNHETFDAEQLLKEFQLYDRSVDIVSAYHWLFTETRELPSVTRFFDRYPRIKLPSAKVVTPDFAVLTLDGRLFVAEIANLGLHENSVEKLCRQISNYDLIEEIAIDGQVVSVASVDVILLCPIEVGHDAARRVFTERIENQSHWYKPKRRPVLTQFTNNQGKYVFQRWPDVALNGALAQGDHEHDFASFGPTLTIPADHFKGNKVQYAFANDPIPRLYLAARLWASVFPSISSPTHDLVVSAKNVCDALQSHYGYGRINDVERAMSILVAAGVAALGKTSKSWIVHRGKRLHGPGDAAEKLALAAEKSVRRRVTKRRPEASTGVLDNQGTLFEGVSM